MHMNGNVRRGRVGGFRVGVAWRDRWWTTSDRKQKRFKRHQVDSALTLQPGLRALGCRHQQLAYRRGPEQMCHNESGFTATNDTHPTPPTIACPIPLLSVFGCMQLYIEKRVFMTPGQALDYIQFGTRPRKNCTSHDQCTLKRMAL